MTRPQRGYVYKAFGAWHVRYREDLWQQDGTTKRGLTEDRIPIGVSAEKRRTKASRRNHAFDQHRHHFILQHDAAGDIRGRHLFTAREIRKACQHVPRISAHLE
jgi:hypothetical protein